MATSIMWVTYDFFIPVYFCLAVSEAKKKGGKK